MKYKIKIINAFTTKKNHGNPAGFLYTDTQLKSQTMQAIAQKMALSETAFVHPALDNPDTYRVHFYTPNSRIANCGHATVASFGYLKQIYKLKANRINIINDLWQTEVIFKKARSYLKFHDFSKSDLSVESAKQLQPTLSRLKLEPKIISCGNRFLSFELDETTLKNIKINRELILKISGQDQFHGLYPFAQIGHDFYTRMFAPIIAIEEESATGTAAAALYCWLKEQGRVNNNELTIYQGYFMHPIRQAQIHCFEQDDNLWVGGDFFVADERVIEI